MLIQMRMRKQGFLKLNFSDEECWQLFDERLTYNTESMINMTEHAVKITLDQNDPYFAEKIIFNKTVPHFFNQTEHKNMTIRDAAYAIRG